MRRRLPLALAALLLACVGVFATVAYAAAADQRAVAGRRSVWVLIATHRIPAGTTARAVRSNDYTNRVVMPAETVPPGALEVINSDIDDLAATADVKPGQLLMRAMFDKAVTLSGGLNVPPDGLAVSVSVDLAGDVAGYIVPGADVAILLTYTPPAASPDPAEVSTGAVAGQTTKILLPRVEVIAVGVRTDASKSPVTATSTEVLLTLAVDQYDAQRLVQAANTGKLSAALLGDSATVQTGAGVNTGQLF